MYALEGSIAVTGSLVQWLRDNLGLIAVAPPRSSRWRGRVDDNGGVYFVPAFSGLFAPYWRADARGAIVGLTRFVNRGHIARAALEATAYQTREVVDAMRADSGVELTELQRRRRNDGQRAADAVPGGPCSASPSSGRRSPRRPRSAPPTPPAWRSASGTGWTTCAVTGPRAPAGSPTMDDAERERLYAEWKKAVTRTFDWA